MDGTKCYGLNGGEFLVLILWFLFWDMNLFAILDFKID